MAKNENGKCFVVENEKSEKLLAFFFTERQIDKTGEGNCLISYSDHHIWQDIDWKGKNIKNVLKSVL